MAFYPDCIFGFVDTTISANNLYPDRATILEPSEVRNASGGISKTYAAIATDVPCRLSTALRQGTESNQGGKPTARKANVIYFQSGQAVAVTARIVVTTLKRYKAGDNPTDDSGWSSPVFDVVFPHLTSDEVVREVEVEERI